MKVGTDGVLLGAWTECVPQVSSILDVGAGTGLVALMLAQRSAAPTIDAIEIDDPAFEQCVENFEASPWGDRLFCYHGDFIDFVAEMNETYDLIVSNPPFHNENVTSGSTARDRARQNNALPFAALLQGISLLLSENGSFSTIVPKNHVDQIVGLANENGLFPHRRTWVKGHPNAPIKRGLMQFTKQPPKTGCREDILTIEQERHQYTPEYIRLIGDFYLEV